MVVGVAFQRTDGEVIVVWSERDQEICVRLLLSCDGLRVESRDCGGEEDSRIPRFECYRQIVDNKLIEAFLNDIARRQGLDNESERKDDTGMKLTVAQPGWAWRNPGKAKSLPGSGDERLRRAHLSFA
jgi:hypothetical protein